MANEAGAMRKRNSGYLVSTKRDDGGLHPLLPSVLHVICQGSGAGEASSAAVIDGKCVVVRLMLNRLQANPNILW